MLTIGFSYKYNKLPEGNTAILVMVTDKNLSSLPEVLLEYDTRWMDDQGAIQHYGLYDLDKVIVLLFLEPESGKLFTTIRPYNPEKFERYYACVGEKFFLEVKSR